MPGVIVDYGSDGIATITFDRPATLNSITAEDYNDFANALRDIDARPDILATIWRATGNFFCSGTDLSEAVKKMAIEGVRARHVFGPSVYPTNTDTSQALYSHSKILIAALNGPVLGIAAPFVSHCDLIYCVPSTYLTVPFVSLGLISEAGSSVSFANRMGLARANEVLLAGKKLSAEELLQCNFVNEIIPAQSTDAFHAIVRERVQTLVQTADPVALLATKRLIRTGVMEKNDPDGVNMRESLEQSKRLGSGVPGRRFKVLAAEVGHKSKL